jgi:hypothetical protein
MIIMRPITSILRILKPGSLEYSHAVIVRWYSNETIELIGLDKPITLAQMREMRTFLKSKGVTTLIVKRLKKGKFRTIIHEVKR